MEASPQVNHFWHKGSKFINIIVHNTITPNTRLKGILLIEKYFIFLEDRTIGAVDRYVTGIKKINSYTINMLLSIRDVQEEDAGIYRCQAGSSEATVRLYGN